MPNIQVRYDQTFVEGRSRETAAALVEAAKELDLVREVFTTSRGYIVPTKVHEAYELSLNLEAAEEEEEQAQEETQEQVQENTSDENKSSDFDPSEHTVDEVTAYLEGATEEERNRVLALEADGKARATLIGKN